MMEYLKELLFNWIEFGFWVGFWGGWIVLFLVHKGIDKEWAERHPNLWWFLVIATFFFYITFRDYLDWNVSGPNPTPCLGGTLFTGIMIGRYVLPKQKKPQN